MLTDDVTIEVKAGNGGDGVVRFSKTLMTKGPTGGNGGNGGNVVLRGVSDLGALRPFRTKKAVKAESGGRGDQNMYTGANGDDLVIPVPVGTGNLKLLHTLYGQDQKPITKKPITRKTTLLSRSYAKLAISSLPN